MFNDCKSHKVVFNTINFQPLNRRDSEIKSQQHVMCAVTNLSQTGNYRANGDEWL